MNICTHIRILDDPIGFSGKIVRQVCTNYNKEQLCLD